MSKELEALERGIIEFEKDLEDDPNNEWLKRTIAGMKKCYQRLEQIDNAKPSEAMKCLENIGELCYIEANNSNESVFMYANQCQGFDTIKQALIKLQEQEKVLEIIKRVYTDLCFILSYDTFEEYDRTCDLISVQANLKRVNKEEFELLKRYFN